MTILGGDEQPNMVEVPLAYDETGRPVEWVWVPRANANDWNAAQWHPLP